MGRSSAKATKGSGSPGKSPPVSAFNSGKCKKGPLGLKGNKKDDRHHAVIEGLQGGLAVIHFRKFNKEEAAYIGPWERITKNDAEKMADLKIAAFLKRRGPDGFQLPQEQGSTWGWTSVLIVLGEEENTEENREQVLADIIADINAVSHKPLFAYPKKFKIGSDATKDPKRCVDRALMDKDVVQLLAEAYPETNLDELHEYEEVMEKWFADPKRGETVINDYLSSHSINEEEEDGVA